MADAGIANFTKRYQQEGEVATMYLVSPATMDSADTVVISTLLNGRTVVDLSAWDLTSDDSVTATISSGTVTVDAAGSTTDHQYVIKVSMLLI